MGLDIGHVSGVSPHVQKEWRASILRNEPYRSRRMIRLLICDDAVAFSTLLSHYVEEMDDVELIGITHTAAATIERATELLPDVILIDHLLEDATSEELVPQLRLKVPNAALLLVSGMPTALLAETARTAGADAFISKASSPEQLGRAIVDVAAAR